MYVGSLEVGKKTARVTHGKNGVEAWGATSGRTMLCVCEKTCLWKVVADAREDVFDFGDERRVVLLDCGGEVARLDAQLQVDDAHLELSERSRAQQLFVGEQRERKPLEALDLVDANDHLELRWVW